MMSHDSIMMSQVHQRRSIRDVSNNEILNHFSFLSTRDCSCGAVMGKGGCIISRALGIGQDFQTAPPPLSDGPSDDGFQLTLPFQNLLI